MEFKASLSSVFLLLHVFINGCSTGILGPTLPQLQCLFSCSLHKISSLFTASALGHAVGTMVSGLVMSKFHPYLILCLLLTTEMLGIVLFPSFLNIGVAVTLWLVIGFTINLSFCVCFHLFKVLWPQSKKAVVLLFSAGSTGHIAVALMVKPFLTASGSSGYSANTSLLHNSTDETLICSDDTAFVRFAFQAVGVLALPVIISYLVQCWGASGLITYNNLDETQISQTSDKRAFVILFAALFVPSQSYGDNFGALLTVYGHSKFGSSPETTSWMTFLLWAMFTAVRMVMSLFPNNINQAYIIAAMLVVNLVAMVFLALTLSGSVIWLWLSTLLVGAFAGTLGPAGMNWAEDLVVLSKNDNVVLFTAMVVGSALSYPCGWFMDLFGIDEFVYFFVSLYSIIVALFLVLLVMAKTICSPVASVKVRDTAD